MSTFHISKLVLICISLINSVHSSIYLNETVFISIDITIQLPVSQLLNKASTNIEQIIQTSFIDTNQDPLFSISSINTIDPISNYSTCNYDDTSFRYHTILNVYFNSKKRFNTAISKYQQIFSIQMDQFIESFQSYTRDEIKQTLNTDGISNNAVIINSLNMIRGHNIMQYNKKTTNSSSTKTTAYTDANPSTVTAPSSNVFTEALFSDNLLIIIILAIAIICMLGFALTCCWYYFYSNKRSTDQQKQSRGRTQSKDDGGNGMIEAVKYKLEQHNKNNTMDQRKRSIIRNGWTANKQKAKREQEEEEGWFSDEIGSDVSKRFMIEIPKSMDPWDYGIIHVRLWLQAHRLQQYYHTFADVTGERLLKEMSTYQLEHHFGIVEEHDIDKIMIKINELRARSKRYKEWMNDKMRNERVVITRKRVHFKDDNRSEYNYKFRPNSQHKRNRSRHNRSRSVGQYSDAIKNGKYETDSDNESDISDEYENKREERVAPPVLAPKSVPNLHDVDVKMKRVNGAKYYLSDDDSHSDSKKEGGDSSDDTELNDIKNKPKPKRKPPKELRRRASQKKKEEKEDSVSKSSTIEIIPVNKQKRHRSVEVRRKNGKKGGRRMVVDKRKGRKLKLRRNGSEQINRKSTAPMAIVEKRKRVNRKESNEGTEESETSHDQEPVQQDKVSTSEEEF